jgi:HK97 family phage major capsid protein
MGGIPEAIWVECCATLTELSLAFYQQEVDCYKVGGYFAVCNATLEDSDIALATELVNALGASIAIAVDKAVMYGRNASGTLKMPLGIVTRLVQTESPAGYPATARPWEDLHTSNVISITAANSTGLKLFQNLAEATGAASDKYAAKGLTWYMNNKTKQKVMAESMSINAAGAIVAGVGNQMPVLGGEIETLSFLADNIIIVGYFENYLLAERAGIKISSSEHAQFIQDNTLFKGTARYDGGPTIAEAFAVIGIAGTTPTATMTFAS